MAYEIMQKQLPDGTWIPVKDIKELKVGDVIRHTKDTYQIDKQWNKKESFLAHSPNGSMTHIGKPAEVKAVVTNVSTETKFKNETPIDKGMTFKPEQALMPSDPMPVKTGKSNPEMVKEILADTEKTFQEISDYFTAVGKPMIPKTLAGLLSVLTSKGVITRVKKGVYKKQEAVTA